MGMLTAVPSQGGVECGAVCDGVQTTLEGGVAVVQEDQNGAKIFWIGKFLCSSSGSSDRAAAIGGRRVCW